MSMNGVLPDCAAVTRFEVINHARAVGVACHPGSGRIVVAYGIRAELALQDDGRTLKVFLDDREDAATAGPAVP